MSDQRDFNPNSIDAQLAAVLARLGAQDIWLRAIHRQTKLTNGRVTKLELRAEGRWRYLVGCAVGISLIITTLWAVFQHFTK